MTLADDPNAARRRRRHEQETLSINDCVQMSQTRHSRTQGRRTFRIRWSGSALVRFLRIRVRRTRAFSMMPGGDQALSNRYFNLLSGFIDKFSLRYDLRRPCMLCPTLPGLFASLDS